MIQILFKLYKSQKKIQVMPNRELRWLSQWKRSYNKPETFIKKLPLELVLYSFVLLIWVKLSLCINSLWNGLFKYSKIVSILKINIRILEYRKSLINSLWVYLNLFLILYLKKTNYYFHFLFISNLWNVKRKLTWINYEDFLLEVLKLFQKQITYFKDLSMINNGPV